MIRKQDRLSINLSQTAAHCKANPPCVNAGFGIYYISIRDDNVIETCDKYNIAMAMTGLRLFHH